tara:strand:+ start:376 stop:705 length:330 start_codon:yes stop_codon:yes gene_type:complete
VWLFTTKGFLSVVQHKSKPDYYQVKSRVSEPLEDYWPEHEIQVIDWADYRFRIDVLKVDASSVITEILESIDYTSFKNNCEGGSEYYRALTRIWSIMYTFQSEMENQEF